MKTKNARGRRTITMPDHINCVECAYVRKPEIVSPKERNGKFRNGLRNET